MCSKFKLLYLKPCLTLTSKSVTNKITVVRCGQKQHRQAGENTIETTESCLHLCRLCALPRKVQSKNYYHVNSALHYLKSKLLLKKGNCPAQAIIYQIILHFVLLFAKLAPLSCYFSMTFSPTLTSYCKPLSFQKQPQ